MSTPQQSAQPGHQPAAFANGIARALELVQASHPARTEATLAVSGVVPGVIASQVRVLRLAVILAISPEFIDLDQGRALAARFLVPAPRGWIARLALANCVACSLECEPVLAAQPFGMQTAFLIVAH